MLGPKEGDDSLDNLKKRLYTRGELGRRVLRQGRLRPHQENIERNWSGESLKKSPEDILLERVQSGGEPKNLFKKFFLGAAIFFVLALLYAAYQFFAGGNVVSSKNIAVSVFGPAFISGGDELSLQVSVENRNSVPLEFAHILLSYPRGAGGATSSSTPDMIRKEIPLQKIPAGGEKQEIVKLVLYGEEGSQQNINFVLEYRLQGSNAIFQKETVYPVKISSAPINLSFSGPKDTNSGQQITFVAKASSNAPKDVPDVLLQIDYPPGFLFKNAEPAPSHGNNVWRLGDFRTGSSRQVTIFGTLSGENGEERTFRVLTGSASLEDDKTIGVIFNSVFQTVAIHRPFLDAVASINGDTKESTAISPGKEVKGVIFWKNNLPTRITSAEITLKFSGNALDKNSIVAETGYYNSSLSSIVWDRNGTEDFNIVEPGSSGTLPFTFRPAALFSAGTGFIKNPEISLQITVKGEVNLENGGSGATSVTTEQSAKVATDLQVLSRAAYSTGPFQNTGSLPPKAESETTYSILWSVTNSANEVSGAVAAATLPPYVSWAGKTYPESEDISYDEGSRAVTWRLNSVVSGTGYQKEARQAYFQVKLVPSISHIGSPVSLTGPVSLSGFDNWSGAEIQSSKNPPTTTLSTDPSFKQGDDIVGPAQ